MQYDVIRNFYQDRLLIGQKYLRMEIRSLIGPGLVRKQDVVKGRGLEPKVNVFKVCVEFYSGDAVKELM